MPKPLSPAARLRRALLLLGLAGLLCVGLFVGWKWRKQAMVRSAFAEGAAAFERGDWQTARAMLGRYVAARPDDLDALAKYAQAQLNMRPVTPDNLRQAMGAFRQVLRTRPDDDLAFTRLARLYLMTGAPGELEFIAAKRLERRPADPAADLARARALIARDKPADAAAILEALATRLEPLVTGGERLATRVEPLVTDGESLATRGEPLATRVEPRATGGEPVATRLEPLVTGGEPGAVRDRPQSPPAPSAAEISNLKSEIPVSPSRASAAPEPAPASPARASSVPEPAPASPARASSVPEPAPASPARASSEPEPAPAALAHTFAQACVLRAALAARAVSPGGDSRNEATARAWLDRAVAACPRSLHARVHRAALPRSLARQAGRDPTADELAAARADLEQASALPPIDPTDLLALAEEWLAHAALGAGAATPTAAVPSAAVPPAAAQADRAAAEPGAVARAADPAALARDPSSAARDPAAVARDPAAVAADSASAAHDPAAVARDPTAGAADPAALARDRAAAAIAAARALDPELVAEHLVDPAEWTLALYRLESRLLLAASDLPAAVKLTQAALAELEKLPQRVELLPPAVEVFVAAGMLDEARARCDQFENAGPGAASLERRQDQVALLRALIDRAAGRPFDLINRLEARVRSAGDLAPAMRGLLAEAYAATGQSGRVARVLGESAGPLVAGPTATKALARACLEQGEHRRVRELLAALQPDQRDAEAEYLRIAAELSLAFDQPGADASAADASVAALRRQLTQLRDAHPRRADLRVLLAAVAESRGDARQAEAELAAALDACDETLSVMLALARLHARHDRFQEAEALLARACREHADKAAPWIAHADLLRARGRVEDARAVLAGALDSLKDSAERRGVAVARALFEIQDGDRPAGVAQLRELAAADPKDVRTRTLLLGVPEFLRDPAAQQTVAELKAIEGDAGVQWRLHRARLLLSDRSWRGRPEARREIEALLKFCIDADPRSPAAVLALGGMYEELGELAQAELTYAGGYRQTSATEVADRLMALYLRQKKPAQARDLLKELQPRLTERALGARRLSLALGEGRVADALRELELRAAAPDGDPVDLVRLAALTYAQKKDAAAALKLLDRAAAAGAPPHDLAHVRVTILKSEQRLDEALAALNGLVASSPTPQSYVLRAAFHASIGRDDLAERDYHELARIAPDDLGYAALGEFHAQAGDLDKAIEVWTQGLAAYPQGDRLKRGLSKALLMRRAPGDVERAGQLLTELAAAAPDDTEVLWVRAVHLASQESPQARTEALALLEKTVAGPAASADTYEGVCRLARQLGASKLARDAALRGLQIHAENRALLVERARAELDLGDLAAAARLARGLLEGEPREIAALEISMEVANRQRDETALKQGLERVEQWLGSDPGSEALHLVRARIHLALGHADIARELLEKYCASQGARSVLAWTQLGGIGLGARDLALLERAVAAASALAPDDPGVLRMRWSLLAAQGKPDELLASVDGSPTARRRPELLVDAAQLLAGMGRQMDAAARLCEEAVRIAPGYARAHVGLGDLRYQKRDVDGAERSYRAALEADPSNVEALNNLAWLLAERGARGDEALRLARRAETLRPRDANIQDTLGFVLKSSGKPAEAREAYRRAAQLAEGEPELRARAMLQLAGLCAELKDAAGLRESLAACLQNGAPPPFFTPAERAEIDRLTALAAGPD